MATTEPMKSKGRPRYRVAGSYTLIEEIGEGGMGVVLKGKDPSGAFVAVKVLNSGLAESSEARGRFDLEARALERMTHPNVVRYIQHGVHKLSRGPERSYIAMEWLDGESLAALLGRRRLAVGEALEIFKQVCRGVIHAHSHEIIHRDLKPANIFVCKSGVTKVLDFGIAKALDASDGLTQTGMFFGTTRYAAPEQFENSKDVDERADVYALGCIFYRMLSGADAFPIDEVVPAFVERSKGPPQRPHQIDPALWEIVSRCLQARREDRYQQVTDLLLAIENYRLPVEQSVAKTGVAIPGVRRDAVIVPTELHEGPVVCAPTEACRTVAVEGLAAPVVEPAALEEMPRAEHPRPKEPGWYDHYATHHEKEERRRVAQTEAAQEQRAARAKRRQNRVLAFSALVSFAAIVYLAFSLFPNQRNTPSEPFYSVDASVRFQVDAAVQQDAVQPRDARTLPRPPPPVRPRRDPLAGIRNGDGTFHLPSWSRWTRMSEQQRSAICTALRAEWVRGGEFDRYCPPPAQRPTAPSWE